MGNSLSAKKPKDLTNREAFMTEVTNIPNFAP